MVRQKGLATILLLGAVMASPCQPALAQASDRPPGPSLTSPPGPWQMMLIPGSPIPGGAWLWNSQTGATLFCATVPQPVCVLSKFTNPAN